VHTCTDVEGPNQPNPTTEQKQVGGRNNVQDPELASATARTASNAREREREKERRPT